MRLTSHAQRAWRSAAAAVLLATSSACAAHSFLRDEGARTVPEADYRAALMRVELAHGKGYYLANASRDSGQLFGNPRRYLLVDAGHATPVFALSNRALPPDVTKAYEAPGGGVDVLGGTTQPAQHTIQFTIPIAFHLFWDPFTFNQPIVNTDYTFGFDLSDRTALWLNTEQRLGVYWGHVSTHLGDEYVISGRSIPGAKFPRVNVSYFPWRVNGSQRWYSTTEFRGSSARSYKQVGAQLEGACLRCNDTGYYYANRSETQGIPIPIIRPGLEWTASAEWHELVNWKRPAGPPTVASLEPPSVDVGFLIGSRRIFPYLNPDSAQHYGIATNATVGYRFPVGSSRVANYTGVYLRWYRGPNPYGQLRNQKDFYLYSLGLKLLQ